MCAHCTLYWYAFFNPGKLLVLLSGAVSAPNKKTIIPALGFSHPQTSKRFTEGRSEAQRAKMKENPPASGTAWCAGAAPQLSAPLPYMAMLGALSWLPLAL